MAARGLTLPVKGRLASLLVPVSSGPRATASFSALSPRPAGVSQDSGVSLASADGGRASECPPVPAASADGSVPARASDCPVGLNPRP